jgi:ketosteroid isomerase-like protein
MKRLKVPSVVVALVFLTAPMLAQRGAPPPVPQEMQDVANRLVELINSQNADGLAAMTASDAILLDEDGHAPPASVWIGRITDGPKTIEISGMRGQTWGNTGWVSFNYILSETLDGQAVSLPGTASVVLEQVDGNWMIRMVHTALEQHANNLIGTD